MMLKTPKKKGGKRKKDHTREDDDDDNDDDTQKRATADPETERDPDDPLLSTPMPRYNAMLAVLRSTLYMHVPTILLTRLELILSPVTEASSNEAPASTRSMISIPLLLTRWIAMSA